MRNNTKKGIKIPRGTEQETGLTRGKTEKAKPDVANKSAQETGSRKIPKGTEQETGLTLGQTE